MGSRGDSGAGGSDAGFLEKLAEHQGTNRVYVPDRKKITNFGVKHYAGTVVYDGNGFLEKNRDTLYLDLIEMLQSSTSSFVRTQNFFRCAAAA